MRMSTELDRDPHPQEWPRGLALASKMAEAGKGNATHAPAQKRETEEQPTCLVNKLTPSGAQFRAEVARKSSMPAIAICFNGAQEYHKKRERKRCQTVAAPRRDLLTSHGGPPPTHPWGRR